MKQTRVVFFHNFQEISSDLNAVKILKISNTYLNYQADWKFKTIWIHLFDIFNDNGETEIHVSNVKDLKSEQKGRKMLEELK